MKAWRTIVILTLSGLLAIANGPAGAQQTIPAPSQVRPPDIQPAPPVSARIVLPRVEAGGEIPAQAKKLAFVLLGFDIEGEFTELADKRRELEAALVGKRITVAQVFEFAAALQAAYVRAGYPLVRVVISPQELGKAARVGIRVVDGFVERIDVEAIAQLTRRRVLDVVSRLLRKPHLTQAELERVLLIAGDAPGLVLNAVFTGGKEVGGTILVLTGTYKPVSVSLYGDNSMPAVFGGAQLVSAASLNGVLGFGEQVTVSAAGLPDNDVSGWFPTRRYVSAGLAAPIGVDGLKFDVLATNGRTTPRVPDRVFRTQGLLNQGRVRLAFDAIKRRDVELTFSARLDATDEEQDLLFFEPRIPRYVDRLRVVRGNMEGIWRLRDSGTVFTYGATISRGLNGLGARTSADAAVSDIPLSRQAADAVFSKLDGHLEVTQGLPSDFFLMAAVFGQTSFNHALLNSEQYDIVGPRMLSGYTVGSFPGDTAWVARGELGRNYAWSDGPVPTVLTPYLFVAGGERFFMRPTLLETEVGLNHMRATNLGGGLRYNLLSFGDIAASLSGFVEGSRQRSDDPTQRGWRVFTGALLRY